ncbi:MAG: SURF1 family protein [Rhodospirillaceae bacterium]|jgi:surfeit locus 1 family protein|nr:SURF1 family protein [Rhodospirillaceae bacterium]MBT3491238.1 SURF1 family protein [Rhodospirillaceae bacterium]MBT3781139.1 SURF1 family protein [Rhodospirillaceae bacterium]MBT3979541.1 SURF1 family protein [Rhodospirillaceae bacterium]MBT4169827.1 SURF1 family protein [Rhodospirillaceae bacterium]
MRRPGLWSICLTLFGLILMLSLGIWQLQRMAWKDGLAAEIAAGMAAAPMSLSEKLSGQPGNLAALNYRSVRVRGRFLHQAEAFLGPRSHQGQSGLHVLTPLRLANGATILINRGWVPNDRRDPSSRAEGQPRGEVAVQGVLRSHLKQGTWTPDYDAKADLWFWYDIDGIATSRGLNLRGGVVQADGRANPGGLPIGGVAQPALVNNHLQYAITWFSLSAVLLAVFLLANRGKREET